MRENAIELLSRVFLAARSFERRTRSLSPYQSRVADLLREWCDDTPQVAFLGAFSSGKSTLINRALGRDLLPASRTPTTAVLTSIAYGHEPVAEIVFRDSVEVPVLTEHGQSTDADTLNALIAWLQQPREFGVAAVEVIEGDGLPRRISPTAALERLVRLRPRQRDTERIATHALALGRRVLGAVASRGLGSDAGAPGAAVYRVTFAERSARALDLRRPTDTSTLAAFLTNPAFALTVRRAICRLPVDLLAGMQFLDTAGLCSPVSFHTDVTAELLERRPDKVVVLLDARRFDSPTNRVALATLARFVQEPEDYRRVTFALTFWDHALRSYMEEDRPAGPLPWDDEAARRGAVEELGASRRRLLRRLLEDVTGVASPVEPSIFLLGLGPKAPHEMGRQFDALLSHLRDDCAGWVGVEMWAERWRAGSPLVEQLPAVHNGAVSQVQEALRVASDPSGINGERAHLNSMKRAIVSAVGHAVAGISQTLDAERELMRLEIARLGSKGEILEYLRTGYHAAANRALDALLTQSRRHGDALLEVTPAARNLRPIDLDRAMLGISAAASARARDHVTGIGYALQSVWDFFFSGIHEATADDRESARAAISAEMRSTLALVERAATRWSHMARRVEADACGAVDDALAQLSARERDVEGHVRNLRKKAEHLERARPHLDRLLVDAEREMSLVRRAQLRADHARAPNAEVWAIFDGDRRRLKRGREADEWVLFDVPSNNLRQVELVVGEEAHVTFVPARSTATAFDLVEAEQARHAPHVMSVPAGAARLVIHLATLRARFWFERGARPRR